MDAINRATASIRQRISGMVLRAVVRLVNDSGGIQLLQIQGLEGEERDEVERIQNYGFSSNPPADSEAVVLAVNGDRGHLLAVAVDHRASRKTNLATGDVVMFSVGGYGVLVKAGGNVMLGGDNLTDPVARKSDLTAIVSAINAHTHGGPASAPPAIVPGCSSKVFSA